MSRARRRVDRELITNPAMDAAMMRIIMAKLYTL